MFIDLDCNLLEVNPWAITHNPDTIFEDEYDKEMTCIDAKVIIDDNSLFR
jgi:succinyl-CoA synthetase beta subunit